MNTISINKFNKVTFKFPYKDDFISIVIPVYKDYHGLIDTLKSLKNQINNSKHEIIVANDGADNKISEVCSQYNVKEIKIYERKGSYNARNQALQESRGEFILFTDADVIVPPDWILEYQRAFKNKLDYVGGNILIDPIKIKNYSNFIDSKWAWPIENIFKHSHYFLTANLAVRRKIIENIGGFDIRLRSSGDWEFGDRVSKYSKFKQRFVRNDVIHPPRNYSDFPKKFKRIEHGHRILYLIYPERFKELNKNIYEVLRKSLYIPKLKNTDTKNFSPRIIVILLVWFQIVQAYYYIKYKMTINQSSFLEK